MTEDRIERVLRRLIARLKFDRGRLDQQARNVEALRRDVAEIRSGKGYTRTQEGYDPEPLRQSLPPRPV